MCIPYSRLGYFLIGSKPVAAEVCMKTARLFGPDDLIICQLGNLQGFQNLEGLYELKKSEKKLTFAVCYELLPEVSGSPEKTLKMTEEYKKIVEQAWEDKSLLDNNKTQDAIRAVIDLLDKGNIRVAEPGDNGWIVNEWIKKAVILYFPIQKMEVTETPPFEFHDKIALKKGYKELGIRVVPHAIARYGSYLAKGVIMMPSYVNIGAYVDSGTMVDTWSTVGSCAQIGKNVHLSGGVGVGGVLEPVQAAPVIIEDNCFIGSRCIVVEGAHIEKEAVLGANTVITKTTRVIDVSGDEPKEYRGFVPARSVVIPGTVAKKFPAGEYNVPVALIIGQRKESTNVKTSLNDALRDYNVAV